VDIYNLENRYIKDGINEVRDGKESGKKLQTLKDFLRESRQYIFH